MRGTPEQAVVLLRWGRDPRLYGLPVDLGDPAKSYFYASPMGSSQEWLDELFIGLLVNLETGLVSSVRRVVVDDYIELRDPSWPYDERFYLSTRDPHDDDAWPRAPEGPESGITTAFAAADRDAGRLITLVTAHENNGSASPLVAAATVSWRTPPRRLAGTSRRPRRRTGHRPPRCGASGGSPRG